MSRDGRLPGGFVSLPSEEPLLCPREEKAQRETSNCVKQLEAIEAYVLDYGVTAIREGHVLELHRLAIEGLYRCGGQYRNVTRDAKLDGGGATHVPPEPALVPGLVREALDVINDTSVGAVERMAYALWRFNWIHPFAGGNGRTSRAIAYFIWCIDMKMMPGGVPTFPTRIADERDAYVEALRAADVGGIHGGPDLEPMMTLIYRALIGQLDAALRDRGKKSDNPGG